MRLFSILIIALSFAFASVASAQQDPRLAEAVESFQSGEFAKAGALLDEVAKETPSNLLNLNAMAAWYKADRCEEAMAARSRVDRTQQLDPQDLEDLDRVNAYCKLKSARAFRDANEWDKGLGLLAGLETQDSKLAAEIVALREQIENDKRAEQAKLAEQDQETEPEPIDQPAEPDPIDRPTWARNVGFGLVGAGAVLGGAALVKSLAFDGPAHRANRDAYAEDWCGGSYDSCEEKEVITRDATWLVYDKKRKLAQGFTIGLGVAGGVTGAAGIALLIHHYAGTGERAATVAPLLGPGTRGLVFSLQF